VFQTKQLSRPKALNQSGDDVYKEQAGICRLITMLGLIAPLAITVGIMTWLAVVGFFDMFDRSYVYFVFVYKLLLIQRGIAGTVAVSLL